MIQLHNTSTHTGCHVDPVTKQTDPSRLSEASIAYLLVSGMGCPACAMRVHNALLQLDGVLDVNVALERGVAQVHYDAKVVGPDHMPGAVDAAGQDGRHHYGAQVLAI